MSQNNSSPIGSVVERKPGTSPTSPRLSNSGKTGFPTVQHRSKSAFARNRIELQKASSEKSLDAPKLIESKRPLNPVDPDDWRNQMSHENARRIETMTEEEREEERREIVERFGSEVGDLLKRVREARARQGAKAHTEEIRDYQVHDATTPGIEHSSGLEEVPITARDNSNGRTKRTSTPPPALSTSSTRPSSRADRKIRFAELSPNDVHVYESAPPSPRRKILALPPPLNDGSAISLGQWKGNTRLQKATPTNRETEMEPEEGTTEYIRRRYFPDAPANDPNLAWMELSPSESDTASSSLRFDLNGNLIPSSLSSTLPTHLGLHHHAEGSHAGYTLDDVFLLSRSTVPAQRMMMLGVLARIAHKIARIKTGEVDGMSEFVGKEEELRKRIIAAGVEAIAERGSVGARAIEVVWECVVGWDDATMGIEEVELEAPTDAAIKSLPLDFLLPQITTLFAQRAIPQESLSELLAILIRLAQQSNGIASVITTTPKLITHVFQTFLLTPIPPTDTSPPPDPAALQLLTLLVLSSRTNAQALVEPADALLRFITALPPISLYPSSLATSLLTWTLRFYTALASYGFYSNIASTAMIHFVQLGQYVVSDACTSNNLMMAWTGLLEAWTVCAVDPHRTTPTHDILWSQIVSWGWNTEVDDLGNRLGTDQKDWGVWAGVWKVKSAWLEGVRTNGVRGGLTERLECIEAVKGGFENGKAKEVVEGALRAMQQGLSQLGSALIAGTGLQCLQALRDHAGTLLAAIRLWLACSPPVSEGPLSKPPFMLPFPSLSELCARITTHHLWSSAYASESTPHAYAFCRPLAGLLSWYLRLSRRLPEISEDLWMAQALAIFAKLLPGDEEFALDVMEDLTGLVTFDWMITRGLQAHPIIWEKGGISIIKPFLAHTVRPKEDAYIGPLSMSPQSIMLATTQRLPSVTAMQGFGLPLTREWTLTPLDHLLRSGSSSVFKSLSASWDASETDVTRVTLLLTKIVREVLHRFSLTDFILTREEAIFGCMKIFMLEHGQPQNDSVEEVFRDRIVGQFMDDLLRPYTIAAARERSSSNPVIPSHSWDNLDQVATRFLGTSAPFYQYYTDFVALYDAISFSHPLFGRLLLPPTSMRYPADYRKHLWGDFRHILKTIRTPVVDVISSDIREYLWPIETDPQMIGHYLQTLIKDSFQEFLRLVALHHVASNIWPDLRDEGGWYEERASKLLNAVVEQGDIDVVREVVWYRQQKTGSLLPPPDRPNNLPEEVKTSRRIWVDTVGGPALQERLHKFLDV